MISTDTISAVSQKYTLSVYFVLLLQGLLGNLCNILVFAHLKIFRRNQSAFYFIVASIADNLLLIVVLPFRVSDYVFGYDPTRFSMTWCKLRQSLVQAFSLLSFSAVCFAAIDQYLTTHFKAHFRQLSSLKLAHRLICIAIVLWTLHGIPFLIFYEMRSSLDCTIYNGKFQTYYSFVHLCVLSGILPITVSGLAAGLAYTNVRHIIRRQVPIVRRRLDRQWTAMVLSKVAFLILTTSPFIIFRIYLLNRSVESTNTMRLAIEQLVFTITSSLFYLNSAVSVKN